MSIIIEKIAGGFSVDGIDLKKGKCGCTSLAKCCYSWSKVKKKGNDIYFDAKMSSPDTEDNYNWSYSVSKDGIRVNVMVEDARDKDIYSGFIPPALETWVEKGWDVIESKGKREDGIVWRCAMCRWLYKENAEEIAFNDLPDDWKCPKCNVSKNEFERIG